MDEFLACGYEGVALRSHPLFVRVPSLGRGLPFPPLFRISVGFRARRVLRLRLLFLRCTAYLGVPLARLRLRLGPYLARLRDFVLRRSTIAVLRLGYRSCLMFRFGGFVLRLRSCYVVVGGPGGVLDGRFGHGFSATRSPLLSGLFVNVLHVVLPEAVLFLATLH